MLRIETMWMRAFQTENILHSDTHTSDLCVSCHPGQKRSEHLMETNKYFLMATEREKACNECQCGGFLSVSDENKTLKVENVTHYPPVSINFL